MQPPLAASREDKPSKCTGLITEIFAPRDTKPGTLTGLVLICCYNKYYSKKPIFEPSYPLGIWIKLLCCSRILLNITLKSMCYKYTSNMKPKQALQYLLFVLCYGTDFYSPERLSLIKSFARRSRIRVPRLRGIAASAWAETIGEREFGYLEETN